MEWTVNKIRTAFLSYFESKGHKIVDSAPMVLKDDPTLMFTNAGMNQFKDVFLGINEPKSPRIADTQKCLRVSGKHNDLEEVGVDTYHHTMFEMLGNWSFGDYFKKEAIEWAWELLTDVYKIDKDRLYVTVFEGDQSDKLEADTEAENIWKNFIDPTRILRCDKKDNFWEMGETGPCGPCSEIHVDIRPESERNAVDGLTLVNQDHPQVIEIWNLVFMEYNRMASGDLVNLPQKHVDTGMGLERLAVVLQGKTSNYDTDVFSGLISELEKVSGKSYKATDSKEDVAFRVVSDHVRAVAFSIADGQLPSNTGAGYVIRRILRRGIRYGYSFLNINEPFVHRLVAILVDQMGANFNELSAQKELIAKVIEEEEVSFLRTLSKGLDRLNKYLNNNSSVSGEVAFELYDTYGFPIDLTQLVASENKVEVDLPGFEAELLKQKERSRSSNQLSVDDWVILHDDRIEGFVGYDDTETELKVLKYRSVTEKGKEFLQLVFDRTPFYPEGGGQVGDTGFIQQGEQKLSILDTQKENDLIVHKVASSNMDLGGKWTGVVSSRKRRETASNHSATHLLHHVLRKQLGTHVEQKGSLVNPKNLRFDFSHFEKVSDEQIKSIEDEVNQMIANNLSLEEYRNIPIEEAKSKGAMSLFGEKYGDSVRMIQFGDSKELCGGTHVQSTSQIQRFKILSESSVAAGIRRVEAITGSAVFDYYEKNMAELEQIRTALKGSKNVVQAIKTIQADNKKLELAVEEYKTKESASLKSDLVNSAREVNGVHVIASEVSINAKQIKDLAFQLKNELSSVLMVLGNVDGDKVGISVMLDEEAMTRTGLKANELIKEVSPIIQGGGGGQPFFATAGGKNKDGLKQAIDLIVSKV